MSTQKKKTGLQQGEFITPPVRLHYPHLFRPGRVPDSDKETYQAVCLIPPDVDVKEHFVKPWQQELKRAFGEQAKAVIKKLRARGRYPIHDAAEKDNDGFAEGWHFLNLSANYPPLVVDQKRKPILDLNKFVGKTQEEQDAMIAEAERRIFAGCWVRFHINLYAWDNKFGKGVSFGFKQVQLVRQDEPFSIGGSGDPSVFDELDDESGDDGFEDDDELLDGEESDEDEDWLD